MFQLSNDDRSQGRVQPYDLQVSSILSPLIFPDWQVSLTDLYIVAGMNSVTRAGRLGKRATARYGTKTGLYQEPTKKSRMKSHRMRTTLNVIMYLIGLWRTFDTTRTLGASTTGTHSGPGVTMGACYVKLAIMYCPTTFSCAITAE